VEASPRRKDSDTEITTKRKAICSLNCRCLHLRGVPGGLFSMPVFEIVEFIKYTLGFALFALHLIPCTFYQVKIGFKCFTSGFVFSHTVALLGSSPSNCLFFFFCDKLKLLSFFIDHFLKYTTSERSFHVS